ncbi:MAG: HlyC/CorC family transporter [Treponema sp.]|nr:HlyC/CorC family transporter [Treponema sp.]
MSTFQLIAYIVTLIILLLFSAFFSSCESAYLSISKIKLKQMLQEKKSGAKKVAKLKNNIDDLLTTILIGNNFVNSLSSSLATALAISLIGNKGTALATFVMSIIIIIFSEVLPKTVATYHPEKTALKFATPLSIVKFILAPVTKVFSIVLKMINKIEKGINKDATPVVTEEELKTLIDVGNQEGTLESGEKTMLNKIFEFTDLRTRDIMNHRTSIVAIDEKSTYEETVEAFSNSGFSRLAVFSETPATITGIIHYKDVLFYKNKSNSFQLKKVMLEPLFIPETKTAENLLHLFKTEKQNIAIAIDEHGSVSGIVTMDDILKAVFGRITDEYAKIDIPPEERIEILNHAQYRVPGDIPLQTINEFFKLNLESEEFETFGGWLLEQFGTLPNSGEAIKRGNVVYTVEEQYDRKIVLVRISFV